jgi:CBS domain-containing protein
MQVCEFMTRDVETIAPDASLQKAAEAMEAMDVASLPVCAGRRLVGAITDRDHRRGVCEAPAGLPVECSSATA